MKNLCMVHKDCLIFDPGFRETPQKEPFFENAGNPSRKKYIFVLTETLARGYSLSRWRVH
jgi:hypothetical protein